MDNAPDYESGDWGFESLWVYKNNYYKKTIIMKTRILNKINQRIRIVEENDSYLVQVREKLTFKRGFTKWYTLNQFSSLKQALKQKHIHIVMILMRELGYRHFFVEKRINRKKRLGLI